MLVTRMLPALVLAAIPFLGAAVAAQEKTDLSVEQDKHLCKEFRKLGLAMNIDGLMKIVDVPFYVDAPMEETRVLRDRDAVKAKLREFFSESDAPKDVGFTVKEVITYAKLRDKFDKRLSDEDQKSLEAVLKNGDRILFVEVTAEGKRLDSISLFVGSRDGNSKIVGLED